MSESAANKPLRDRFWQLPLAELNAHEWEALCDGCGRCCLKKFVSAESEQLSWTRVVCRYFDQSQNRCTQYRSRSELVPDCLQVMDVDLEQSNWVPSTCAYRLRFENKPLYDWHPLLAGSAEAMAEQGISVADKVISEEYVHPEGYHEHLIRWVDS